MFDKLEVVEADVEVKADVERAVKGATYVVHVASACPFDEPKDEESKAALIKTALNGCKFVMEAARKEKVKRVVLTSSIACVRDFFPKDRLPPGTPYTEE